MPRSWNKKVRRANDRAFDRSLQAEERDRREMQRLESLANFKVKGDGERLFATLTEEEMEEVLRTFVSLGISYQITS